MHVEYTPTVLCKGGLLCNPDVVQTDCVGLFSGFDGNMEKSLLVEHLV